jgi:hypothetical protein
MKKYYEELYQYMSNNPNLIGPFEKLEKIKNNPIEVIKMYNMYKNNIKDYMLNKKMGLREVKKFTIKSEDKAAFINRLEKLGINIDSYDITDDKLNKTFSIEFTNPQVIDTINQVLKQSSKINQVKSSKKVYTDKKSNSGKGGLKEENNPMDVIKLDVPLFIRLLEYAREDAKTDMDLHDVTEKIIAAASKGQTLTMSDYDMIMSDKIQENFNPNDYEWEEEVDPKIINVNSKMGEYSYVDCDVLTINGEVKELTFYLDYTDLENAPADETAYSFCEAEDGYNIYRMECEAEYWGADGYRIVDIDKDSLEFIER